MWKRGIGETTGIPLESVLSQQFLSSAQRSQSEEMGRGTFKSIVLGGLKHFDTHRC